MRNIAVFLLVRNCFLNEHHSADTATFQALHLLWRSLVISQKVSSIELEPKREVAWYEWSLVSVDWFKSLWRSKQLLTLITCEIILLRTGIQVILAYRKISGNAFQRLVHHSKPLNGWHFQIPRWNLCKGWHIHKKSFCFQSPTNTKFRSIF